jgi:hypothetical protein
LPHHARRGKLCPSRKPLKEDYQAAIAELLVEVHDLDRLGELGVLFKKCGRRFAM